MTRPVIEMKCPQWVLDNLAARRRAADVIVGKYQRGSLTPEELTSALMLMLRTHP